MRRRAPLQVMLPIEPPKTKEEMRPGMVFGRLTVLSQLPDTLHGKRKDAFDTWLCQCRCGSPAKGILGNSLRRGGSKSCGCVRKEKSAKHAPSMVRHGPENPRWKGGKILDKRGYVNVWLPATHEFIGMARNKAAKSGTGYVFEHRLVMAQYLGRPLRDFEEVHHVDGDRANNAIENLQLRVTPHGNGVTYRCMDCGSHKVEPVPLA